MQQFRSRRNQPSLHTATRKKRAHKYTARTADKHELYQLAVQSPEADLEFLVKAYKKITGRVATHFREDFCGTALLACEWVKQGAKYSAEGFDLDAKTLAWGWKNNVTPLEAASDRIVLHEADVREKGDKPAHIRVAQNFSYCVFKTRAELLDYFKRVRSELAPGGMFAIDIYGGNEGTEKLEEERKIEEGFTYVWDQYEYLPGNGHYTCYIHFRFKDGSEMKRAFAYDWRFWTMPELKDVLSDAGFSEIQSWFEQSDDDEGEGNGIYKRDDAGRSSRDCAGWVAYILALK
ncbi:MAG: class I SAM-dependent methyltransferase [Planctomycetes bacterium]|nr:class I SAM-dependent methyltransferase [Planctomycetota bacterium]